MITGAEASLVFGVAKNALGVVGRGLEYNSTRDNLEAAVNDLSPMVDQIEDSMKEMNLSTKHVRKLKKLLEKNRDDLKNNQIKWYNWVLAPISQWKLSREHAALERFVSVQTQLQMFQLLVKILFTLSPQGQSHESAHNSDRTTFDNRFAERFPRFTVGLDGNSMQELKAILLGHDLKVQGELQVLNLYGIPGSGKTTMAEALCRDRQVQGNFNQNIIFETLGSKSKSDEAMVRKLREKVTACGQSPVLLVLDDVWPHPENIEMINNLTLPAGSRILVTSRAAMTTVKTRCVEVRPLSPGDAETLFLHSIQPSNIDFKDPENRKILIEILEGCKGLPLAIEFVGRKLHGNQPIEAFQKMQLEWSQGRSILDSHEDLLTRLQNSVDESMKECFMDLGLFPEDQKIPFTPLIDMWIELFELNEPAILSAVLTIQRLIAMNLADRVIVRRKIGRDLDNYYNNHFLMQHDLFRELAIHMSLKEPLENRRSLIIDIYGNPNDPPKWWPKQPQSVAAPSILSISTDQNITPNWCNIQAAATVVLVLNLKTSEYTLPEFIKDMKNLKLLIVTNYGVFKTDLRNLQLLASLLSLKTIRFEQISISSLCDLKKVHKLSLYLCDVKEAFENNSFDFSEAMPKLEDLSIEYCKDLVNLPTGLFNIVAMKKLTISSCHKFIRLPEEIGKLENLETLRITYCAAFEQIPDSITKLKNLSLLDISFCVSLKKLPDNIGKLQNLKRLYMTGCSTRELPDSVIDLNKLESVICDEYASLCWEVVIKNWFYMLKRDVNITKTDMDVNLDWLF
ncbi:hypothetical protein QN277_024101 [Acacia crassicarpa]|uniref:NB-ARC domain-containing protein n=1 Tax=Acacia crassicarpa TaxID=499986 RepID=A0AAE1JCZ1_9FABA|nr:hypothetical protein QN277_024101 [Acacia crassicarpa]